MPQGLLSMPTDNSHKSWETPSDKTSVSSASKSDFLTSSIVIPGQCNFSCSREERMKASPRHFKSRPSAKGAHPYRKRACLEALRLATTKRTQRGTGYQSWRHPTQLTISRSSTWLKECHKTESLWNHTTIDHKDRTIGRPKKRWREQL